MSPNPSKRKPPAKPQPTAVPDPGLLEQQVREAAYYRALQRGFAPGLELEDWLAAEHEVAGRAPQ